jgi:inner membrane protein
MDTITHILLGAVTAQLGFRQRLGAGATLAAAAAAGSPDLDILLAPAVDSYAPSIDAVQHLLAHRGITHSVVGVPLLALGVALAWRYLRRRRLRREAASAAGLGEAGGAGGVAPIAAGAVPFGLMFLCALVGVASHPLLDWCTPYGTELLLPFTDHNFALGVISNFDIFFTPLLVVTLLACFLIRRIRRGPAVRATLAVGWAGMLLAVAYMGTGAVLREKVMADVRGRPEAREAVRIDAYPGLGGLFLWRVVIETPEEWIVMRRRPLFGKVGLPREQRAAKVDDAWVRRAEELPEVREYAWSALGLMRAESERVDGHHVVVFYDLRYAARMESVGSLWPLRVTFDNEGRLLEVQRAHELPRGTVSEMMSRFWSDLWGE